MTEEDELRDVYRAEIMRLEAEIERLRAAMNRTYGWIKHNTVGGQPILDLIDASLSGKGEL